MGSIASASNGDNHDDATETPEERAWRMAVQRECPEPTSQASPGLVAHYLHELEVGWGDTLDLGAVFRWCKKKNIEPMPVLLALRGERNGEKKYSADDIAYLVSEWDWQGWETSVCPVPRWFMDRVTGSQRYFLLPCPSWNCPEHSKARAKRVLDAARAEWMDLDVIYYAVVENLSVEDLTKVVNRVRSRRRPSRNDGMSWFVVRKESTSYTLHFFATVVLPGTEAPTQWVPLMPEEAIERVAEVLELPGPQRVSPQWGDSGDGYEDDHDGGPTDPNTDSAEEESKEGWESPFISLPPVQRGTRDEVLELAEEMAREKWGFTPTTEWFPADEASTEEWADMLKEAVETVRERHRRPAD
jgi:hypothetical protein